MEFMALEFMAHMNGFLMSGKVTFLSCLIITLWTLKFSAHMYRLLMSDKVTFLIGLMFTLWTLEWPMIADV